MSETDSNYNQTIFQSCNTRISSICNMLKNCCCVISAPMIRSCIKCCQSIPCPKNYSNEVNIRKSQSLYRTFDDEDMMDLL